MVMVSAISKCKTIKSCQNVPLSCEKDTVYIASSSPRKNLIKKTQFLYAMSTWSKSLSKFDKVKILSQNFSLIFTYSTAAVAQLYVFKYKKVRLFLFLSLELSFIEDFPKVTFYFLYYSFSCHLKIELLVMLVWMLWAGCYTCILIFISIFHFC